MENGHSKYSLGPELVNSLIGPGTRFVTGQYVAHAKRTRVERAYEAADLVTGKSVLVQPTVVCSAWVWGVNAAYVHWALKRPNDRLLVESGAVPLVPPPVRALPAPAVPSDFELAEIAHRVGAERWLAAGSAAGL
jgi:hypothetical protein